MKTFALVFVCLILAAVCTDANPIMKESVAKQLFRSKRQGISILPVFMPGLEQTLEQILSERRSFPVMV